MACSSEKDADATQRDARGVCAAAFIIIGAVSFPPIVLAASLVGYSFGNSLLIGLFLASPVTVAAVLLVWLFRT